MPDQKRKRGQALMVELQHYGRQGISIWLDGESVYVSETSDVYRFREGVSYMKENPDDCKPEQL